jgi:protein-tyrosine phosphatase
MDLENSLEQLRLAKASGVDLICATSHFYGQQDSVESFLEQRARSWLELKRNMEEGSPRVILGAEVLAFEGIDRLPHLEDLCLMGTNILLLEMPFSHWTDRLLDSVEAVSERQGIQIVLAHVDRYDRKQVESLMKLDRVKGQVNVSALTKHLQSGYLRDWIKEGKIVAVGSDIHGTKTGYTEWQTVRQRNPEEWKTVMQACGTLLENLL